MVITEVRSVLEETRKELLNDNFALNVQITNYGRSLPSLDSAREIVETLRAIIFPGYFGKATKSIALTYLTDGGLDELYDLLYAQIRNALLFDKTRLGEDTTELARELALRFVERLPEIRRLLYTDVEATYSADPAAKNYEEIIFCYPTIRAMINHRLAHALLELGVPLLPRIVSELAHSETGIDIHPGATIGEYFCIDHGTGVVIGETAIIGNHVRLYQGVTLGAKRFSLDENGNPVKDEPRHPIIEDNVVIYSNANILGRITIGKNSIIGGNVWVTHSVPANSKLTQAKALYEQFSDGLGI